ncbi:MAG: hypothetical protein J2P26_01450 [Nocardiopsaceae bacterium]|nr:hypothetical protein [Nocardiopsaceae bacterium]
MNDAWWITALISALSAVVGGGLTGWFTRAAGVRQADAALETARMTLQRQRAERVRDARWRVYLDFIAAADAVITAGRGEGSKEARAGLRRAFGAVQLEGQTEPARTAGYLLDCLRGAAGQSLDDRDRARQEFIDAARDALASAWELPARLLRATPRPGTSGSARSRRCRRRGGRSGRPVHPGGRTPAR